VLVFERDSVDGPQPLAPTLLGGTGSRAMAELRSLELGPLRLDQWSGLVWPHAYVPSFTLVPDRRRTHRLMLRLDLPSLRGLAFDTVVVEPSDDPFIRARPAGLAKWATEPRWLRGHGPQGHEQRAAAHERVSRFRD
jgi:hypothetical protein